MLWVLIPLKPPAQAKTRLAPAFGARERRALMREMAAHVVETAVAAGLGPVALVGDDPEVTAFARRIGADLRSDAGLPWNEGLRHAIESLAPAPAAVLIVAADLPLVTAAELRALVAAGDQDGVVIGRAHDGGTNALVLRPPLAIATCFGVTQSGRAHAGRATAAGLPAHVLDLPGVALDVDTPADAIRAGIRPPQPHPGH